MSDGKVPMLNMTLLSATEEEETPSAEDNCTYDVLSGATMSATIPYDEWEEWEKDRFPKAHGSPDPSVMLLEIFTQVNSPRQTCWWVVTSTGKKKVCL